MGIYLAGVISLANLAIANFRMGLLDKSGVVVMDHNREFVTSTPIDAVEGLTIQKDYGYAIYYIDNSLTSATEIARTIKDRFIAEHGDHQLLDAIGISLEDDAYRSAMCDDLHCCPAEGNKADTDKSSFLLTRVEYNQKIEYFDIFMDKLQAGETFDDGFIQDLDVRDAVLTELTNKHKWNLILNSQPLYGVETEEFKTFYALALVFTAKDTDNVGPAGIAALTLLNEVNNYSLAGLVKHALENNAINEIERAFTKFEVSHLLSVR